MIKKLFTLFFVFIAAAGFCQVGQSSNSLTPTGEIKMFGGSVAPAGFLLCQGQAVSRTTYSNLFAVIGTTYGIGDGSTTFNLPDFRGVFPKGMGQNGSLGANYAGASGTPQLDKMQGHYHTILNNSNYNVVHYIIYGTSGGSVLAGAVDFNAPDATALVAKSTTTDGSNGTPRVGPVTEPANVGVNFIIKI